MAWHLKELAEIKIRLIIFIVASAAFKLNEKFKKKLPNKNVLSYLKKNYFTPYILGISIVSLFLLVQLSPIFSLLWLSISTLYFLYIRSYKDISKIWAFTFGIWYLIFTTSLSEIKILIGFENTTVIIY